MINEEREIRWDEELPTDVDDFQLAEPGEYAFQVVSFKRTRFNGSAKMPACNQAELTLQIINDDGRNVTKIEHRILLHTRLLWKIVQFFRSIGEAGGEKFVPNWNRVVGAAGRCQVVIREWTDREGNKRESNDISKFLPLPVQEEQPAVQQQVQQFQQTQPAAQGNSGYVTF